MLILYLIKIIKYVLLNGIKKTQIEKYSEKIRYKDKAFELEFINSYFL